MKNVHKWFLGFALVTTFQVALPQQPAHAGVFSLSEQDEIAAGKQVAQQALKEYGGAMPANHPYSRRVRAIGAQFARLSTRKNIPYSYTVLNDNKVLNAFAGPGGPIFVTRRLMETVSNDAELAYVLGHETGHIENKHVVKQADQQQKAGLLVGVLGAILGRGGSGNAIGAVANMGWAVISSGYSRKDESEADATGARWMSQLGYDPRAAISMLKKLEDGSKGGSLDKYLSTHPDPKVREQKVSDQINSEHLLDVAKQHGGPKLSSGLNFTGYDGSATSGGNNVYPGSNNDDGYYSPDNQNSQGELDFGAPTRLWVTENADTGVVLAPLSGFARWAGATVSSSGSYFTMQRGGSALRVRLDSTSATLNGRKITMSAPATVYGNVLYVPLGRLAAAVGASATLDENQRIVRLSMPGRDSGFVRLP